MKENRIRVCVLTPRFPYPVIGGDRLRIYEICKEISKTCSVTLLSLCESKEEMDFEVPDDGVFEKVARVYLPKRNSFFKALLGVFSRRPLQTSYYFSSEFSELVNDELTEHDVFIPHLIRMADYIVEKPVPSILEMTDAISLNYSRFDSKALRSFLNVKSLIYKLEFSRLLRYEKKCIEKFDAVSLVSGVDKNYLLGQGAQGKIFVCSNGVRLDQFPVQNFGRTDRNVAFIGNMFSVQNLDAVWYFAKNVLPVLRRNGDFRFKVIGRIKESDARRLASVEGVIVRANVKNVSEELSDVFAAVAPVRLGAGVQNKVLEYMSSAIPTVVSELAAEGLEAIEGQDFLIAKDADGFVRSLLSIWEDENFARRLGESGRAYIERRHAWSSQLAEFVSVVEELGGRRH